MTLYQRQPYKSKLNLFSRQPGQVQVWRTFKLTLLMTGRGIKKEKLPFLCQRYKSKLNLFSRHQGKVQVWQTFKLTLPMMGRGIENEKVQSPGGQWIPYILCTNKASTLRQQRATKKHPEA